MHRPAPNRLVRSMTDALFESDLVATRLMLAIGEVCWAIMLLWPGASFERSAYAVMREVMPENAWAGVFLVTSLMQFTVIVLQDFGSRFARYFAAWNASLWLFVAGSILISVYPPPAAAGGEIALMAAAVWIWLRPIVEARGARHAGVRA